jgi:hypothetical protein
MQYRRIKRIIMIEDESPPTLHFWIAMNRYHRGL